VSDSSSTAARHYKSLQLAATCCNTVQQTDTHSGPAAQNRCPSPREPLQNTTQHFQTPQHSATQCNTRPYTDIHPRHAAEKGRPHPRQLLQQYVVLSCGNTLRGNTTHRCNGVLYCFVLGAHILVSCCNIALYCLAAIHCEAIQHTVANVCCIVLYWVPASSSAARQYNTLLCCKDNTTQYCAAAAAAIHLN